MLSDLSYLSYPLPPDVQRLFEAGELARMERVIGLRLADSRTPECLKERLRFQLVIARDLPEAYPFTQAELLGRLRAAVRDFGDEELETLRDDGTLDWRYIEGEVRFKDNCISNLLKTRPEYAARALNPEVRAGAARRQRALCDVITRMKAQGGIRARFELHEEMTVRSDRLTLGETLRIHLPLPVVGAQVTRAALLGTSHPAAFIAPEDEPHRTVCFMLPYQPGMTVSADFTYDIDARYVQPDPAAVAPRQPAFDTQELPPHVVFTPYLRALAK